MNDKKLNNHNEEYTPKKEDFELVQRNEKIYDVKLDTKPTTFMKDAFKRFCKNKSSVVGAIIIGFIMILSIFVPLLSPYDVNSAHPDQNLLLPKLFEAGTGFWDGTKKYTNVVYNKETGTPVGFNKYAVVPNTLKETKGETINIDNANQESFKGTTTGGYYKFVGEPLSLDETIEDTKRLENRTPFTITADGKYTVEFDFGNEAVINTGNSITHQAPYRISIVTGREGASSSSKKTIVVLQDWSTDYSKKTLDLSKAIADQGLTKLDNVSVRIEIQRSSEHNTHILLKSIIFKAENVDEETKAFLSELSMNDPCHTFFLMKNEQNKYPVGYFANSGVSQVYNANVVLASFSYDVYKDKLGIKENFQIGKSDMDKYIANGWVTYDYNVGPSSFKLNEKYRDVSPIKSVSSQTEKVIMVPNPNNPDEQIEQTVYLITGEVEYYRYIGLDSMPRYLLGTTNDGWDLVTLSFVALRTSLLIAIITSAICLIFGLVWGSISGYFGGNVDLVMERIKDVLANVPFIVVMTLTILLLGNNIVTFGLALCLTSWMGVASRTRTQFYRFKGREYILASRTLGASDNRLIFKHILPNSLGTIVTSSVLMIPSVIFSEASISYLGLGLKGVKSFGVILSDNQKYLSTYPALIVFPAIIISLLMISFNLFGNGLRDALNPSLKGSE